MIRKSLILRFFICAIMFCSLLSFNTMAESAEPWGGDIADGFHAGDGSEGNPYQIASAKELAYFMHNIVNYEETITPDFRESYVELISDIDLNNVVWPYASISFADVNKSKIFAGNFNGNNYKITNFNMNITTPSDKMVGGLFPCNAGEIRNLNVIGKINYVSEQVNYVGGIVGYNVGIIDNVIANITMTFTNIGDLNCIGGITGLNGNLVENSINKGDISFLNNSGVVNIGGIAGRVDLGGINNCKNEGNIIANHARVGGISGYLTTENGAGTVTIENCINTGDVEVKLYSGDASVGGIVGSANAYFAGALDSKNEIINCLSIGNVTSSNEGNKVSAGPIFGNKYNNDKTESTLENNYYVYDVEGAINQEATKVDIEEVISPEFLETLMGPTNNFWDVDSDGNIVFKSELADYEELEEVIANIPLDLSAYTPESVMEINNIKNSIVYKLNQNKQNIVDEYITLLLKAIDNLKLKPIIDCAGDKDKNCDGVVTCDEEKGLGWIWNEVKKVCEFKGSIKTYIVNTCTK